MPTIQAKCLVPAEFQKYNWPDKFAALPRAGDFVMPSDAKDVRLVVKEVVHRNHETMHQPPDSIAVVELLCEKPKNELLG